MSCIDYSKWTSLLRSYTLLVIIIMSEAHHFSLDTDTRLLQQVLLQTCSKNSAILIKNELDVLPKPTGVIVKCSTGIAKGF